MPFKNIKMEPRGENEPKYNPNNKTDRKLLHTLMWLVFALVVILGGLITLYFVFFH